MPEGVYAIYFCDRYIVYLWNRLSRRGGTARSHALELHCAPVRCQQPNAKLKLNAKCCKHVNSHDQPWAMSSIHDDIAWVMDLLIPGLLERVSYTNPRQQFGEFMRRHWAHAHRGVLFPRGGFICGGIAYYIALFL